MIDNKNTMAISKEKTEEIKERLKKEKESIEEQLEKSEEGLDFGDDFGSAWEEEETDEAEEYSNYVGVEKKMKHVILEIERAIKRIEDGEYGVCVECGKDIDEEVLDASPTSKLCRECKKKANKK